MGKRLLQSGMLMLLAAGATIEPLQAAQCDYTIVNEWSNGFQAEIRITNNGPSSINGWTVNWEYSDGTSINHGWNASLSGSNPYTASALGWNSAIAPNQSVAFGFVANKGAGQAQTPLVTGDVCAAASSSTSVQSSSLAASSSSVAISSSAPSSSSVISSSSVMSSSIASSSSVVATSSSISSVASSSGESSSSVAPINSWVLDAGRSRLTFSTTKKIHVVENMTFTELAGGISQSGVATLGISLASIESGIDIRNERMRNFLFETSVFPEATVTLPVDMVALENLNVGENLRLAVTASLDLHGVIRDVSTELKVSRLSENLVLVQNVAPILIVADDYDLEAGVEELRSLASLNSIGKVVPVDFTLFFSAQ